MAAGWITVAVALLLDVLGIRRLRDAGRRWQGAGILLSASGVMASGFAAARGWPPGQARHIHSVMLALYLAGVVFLAIGLGVQARSGCEFPEAG